MGPAYLDVDGWLLLLELDSCWARDGSAEAELSEMCGASIVGASDCRGAGLPSKCVGLPLEAMLVAAAVVGSMVDDLGPGDVGVLDIGPRSGNSGLKLHSLVNPGFAGPMELLKVL